MHPSEMSPSNKIQQIIFCYFCYFLFFHTKTLFLIGQFTVNTKKRVEKVKQISRVDTYIFLLHRLISYNFYV